MTFGIFSKLAWRNVLRNKRRTFISGAAIGIGLAALIYADAIMLGMEVNMIDSATASFMGEGQIHREGYRQSLEVEATINDYPAVVDSLQENELVEAFAPRVMAMGMLSSPSNVASVQMVGIDPRREPALSEIDEVMSEGEYLAGESERELMIGSKLAELLEVELGDRVVMTAAQAHTGHLAQEMFRVSGIYHFNVRELDRQIAVVPIDRAQAMLGLDGEVHQIALQLTDSRVGRNADHPLWRRLSFAGNEAVSWTVLMPQLQQAFEMTEVAKWILGLILFGVVALVIVNSLFMSLYERIFEFGVLRAVGTSPLSMGQLVALEAAALAFFAIILGALLGLGVSLWTAHIGIDYSGIEYEGVTFRKLLYPVMQVRQYLVYPAAALAFTILISLYPAVYAARLEPAEAMRRSF